MEVLSVKNPTKENLQFFATSNSEWASDIIKWPGYTESWRRTSTHARSISISLDDSDIRLFFTDGCARCRTRFAPALLSFAGGLVGNY